jgi:hypothetical protein
LRHIHLEGCRMIDHDALYELSMGWPNLRIHRRYF